MDKDRCSDLGTDQDLSVHIVLASDVDLDQALYLCPEKDIGSNRVSSISDLLFLQDRI